MKRSGQRAWRPLHWVGSAKRDLLAMPAEVVDDLGYALGLVQLGGTPIAAKAWKGEGPGAWELVEEARGNAYRVVYTVRFRRAVYVLHCFQKKSPRGVRTARGDVAMVRERSKAARRDCEERYGTTDGESGPGKR